MQMHMENTEVARHAAELMTEISLADSSQAASERWNAEPLGTQGLDAPALPVSSLLRQLLDTSVEEMARLARVLRDSDYVAVLRGVEGTVVPLTERLQESCPLESLGTSTLSAPILGAEGEPIAAIEVLGPVTDVSPGTGNLLRAVVESAARASSERCFRLQHLRDWIIAAITHWDRHAGVLLAVDGEQRVTGANREAQGILKAKHRREPRHQLLSDIFHVGPTLLRGSSYREVPTRALSSIDSQPWSILVTPPTVVPSSSSLAESVRLHTRPRLEMLVSYDRGRRPSQATSPRGLTPGLLRLAQDYIDTHLSSTVTIGELARHLGVSRSHFARAFRDSVGLTPHSYIMRRRVLLAQELLAKSEQPLAEIALSTGFADQSHFSRRFHQFVGLSPSRFRAQHR
jgi:AraC-like DNA-binding protein